MRLAANKEYILAYEDLGSIYHFGANKDDNLALSWYLKAYENGRYNVVNNIANIYVSNKDFKLAKDWFEKDTSDYRFMMIGILYLTGGNGLEQNLALGRELIQKSCDLGVKMACDKLKKLDEKK